MRIKYFLMSVVLMIAAGAFLAALLTPARYDFGPDADQSRNPFIQNVVRMCASGFYQYNPDTGLYEDTSEVPIYTEPYCLSSTKAVSGWWSCGGSPAAPTTTTCGVGKVCQDGLCVKGTVCLDDECPASVPNGSCSGGCSTSPVITCNTNYELVSGQCLAKCSSCQTRSGTTCVYNSVTNGSYSGSCVLSCNSGYTPSGSSCVCQYGSCTSVSNGSCTGGCTTSPSYSCNTGYQLSGTSCVCKYGSCTSVANGGCTGGCTTEPSYYCSGGYTISGSGSSTTCSLSCSYIACGTLANATCSGGCTSQPMYTCNPGFVMVGGQCVVQAACNTSCATYNSMTNTCTANSVANGTYNTSTCDFTCDGGYKKSGGACHRMVKQPSINKVCQ